MVLISLQSGSNGNCYYLESGSTAILVDAGIPGSEAERRLASFGRDIRDVRAVVISHDHADHAISAGVFSRMFGIPVHMTEATHAAAAKRCRIGRIDALEHFAAGETLHIGSLRVETHSTPHDAADGVAVVVADRRRRVGILTDLGHVFPGLSEVVASLHGVLLESNYDPELLEAGPYPAWLKARIKGDGGHISNGEAAEVLRGAAGSRLEWACLGHLSEENNRPALALAASRAAAPGPLPLRVASRFEAVALPEL
jgi:phosphoribosyl 1,2-cyclic phosphodiesterase